MSYSLFDDFNGPQTADLQAADDKTLRLASPLLSEEQLTALMRYQEAFLAHAEQPSVGHPPLVAAHQLGLQASGLTDVKLLEMGAALLRAFCGRRWTTQRLRLRLAELEQQPDAAEKAAKVREELARLEDLEPLARRYGEGTLAVLLRHEAPLIALHTRLSKVLGRA